MRKTSVRLSVNINKIATIRNARGGNTPNVALAAKNIEAFGAEGITVHPRPDQRHITYADVRELKEIVTTEFNVEGYPNAEFMKLVEEVKPHQVTLVPDPPGVLTSNAGWNTIENADFLKDVIASKSSEDLISWAKNQAYLAMGNLLTVCANEQIDSCPMEGFIPEKYDEVLDLPSKNLASVLVLPVGFRAEDDFMKDQKKVRKELDEIVLEIS